MTIILFFLCRTLLLWFQSLYIFTMKKETITKSWKWSKEFTFWFQQFWLRSFMIYFPSFIKTRQHFTLFSCLILDFNDVFRKISFIILRIFTNCRKIWTFDLIPVIWKNHIRYNLSFYNFGNEGYKRPTIQPVSTKRTTIYHLKSLNTKQITWQVDGNKDSGLGRAHIYCKV